MTKVALLCLMAKQEKNWHKLEFMDRDKEISKLQESLLSLYLRLNGYFTSGLIIHSEEKGKIRTEIDRIGIRFPRHKQPERVVEFSTFLQIPREGIDIIISEVKNGGKFPKFNDPLTDLKKEAVSNWKKILRWIGLFTELEIDDLSQRLVHLVQDNGKYDFEKFRRIDHENEFGKITIRPILVAFEKKEPKNGQLRYIHGEEILGYLWYCLNPELPRLTCATRYDFGMWSEYEQIVRYFKDRHKNSLGKGTLNDLYNTMLD